MKKRVHVLEPYREIFNLPAALLAEGLVRENGQRQMEDGFGVAGMNSK